MKPRLPKSKWPRRFGYTTAALGVGYVYDREFNASAVVRSARTAYVGVVCTLDYKINFNPRNAHKIDALHERVAARLRWVIDTNQGLYLKLGQALGLQAALLPKPYREAFGHVFDRAPAVGYDEVVRVFEQDLGVRPEDVFEEFGREAVASASIAQVHRAKLRRRRRKGGEGQEGEKGVEGEGEGEYELVDVAVKVQKPAIRVQMEWDLASYRALMWLAERLFDMPSECGVCAGVRLARLARLARGSAAGKRRHTARRAWDAKQASCRPPRQPARPGTVEKYRNERRQGSERIGGGAKSSLCPRSRTGTV